jgi:hypothetical protein
MNKQNWIIAIKAIADAIREAGKIPSGTIYVAVMGKMDLSQFQQIIDLLKKSGRVTESNYELSWVE